MTIRKSYLPLCPESVRLTLIRTALLRQSIEEQIPNRICLDIPDLRQTMFADKASAHGGMPAAVSDILQGRMQQIPGMNCRIFRANRKLYTVFPKGIYDSYLYLNQGKHEI